MFLYLCARFGSGCAILHIGLKGKQVKILYSPAAVSSTSLLPDKGSMCEKNVLNNTFATVFYQREGVQEREQVRRPARLRYIQKLSRKKRRNISKKTTVTICLCQFIFGSYLSGFLFIVK